MAEPVFATRTHVVLGSLVIAGMLAGIIVPLVAIAAGWYGAPASPGTWWAPAGLFGVEAGRLVAQEPINISGDMVLSIDVDSGAVELSTIRSGDTMVVEVYEPRAALPFIRVGTGVHSYNISVSGRNVSITIDGYYVKVRVPLSTVSIAGLRLRVTGGAASIGVSGVKMRSLEITASGGIVNARIESLVDSNISIKVSGGAADIELSYTGYTGLSTAAITVEGGAADIDMKVPSSVKLAIEGGVSGGYGSISVDGGSVSLPYREPGYDSASSRLSLRVDVTGGAYDIGIHR